MSRAESKNGFRFPEWMVLLGALGILVSVAVPSYFRLVRPDRVQGILTSAAEFSEGLGRWAEAEVRDASGSSGRLDVQGAAGREYPSVGCSAISPEAMQRFLQLYDMTGERPRSSEARVTMEPAGLPLDRCPRDGRIHIIPEAGAAGDVSAVTLVVTDRVEGDVAENRGLLAVYKIRTEER